MGSESSVNEDDDASEDDDEGGYQGNNMAYKSVEIDDNLLREEL